MTFRLFFNMQTRIKTSNVFFRGLFINDVTHYFFLTHYQVTLLWIMYWCHKKFHYRQFVKVWRHRWKISVNKCSNQKENVFQTCKKNINIRNSWKLCDLIATKDFIFLHFDYLFPRFCCNCLPILGELVISSKWAQYYETFRPLIKRIDLPNYKSFINLQVLSEYAWYCAWLTIHVQHLYLQELK